MLSAEAKTQLAPVLGQIPSGVFILVAGNADGQQTGMLASWVQQASFEPPQVTVAVNKSRYLIDWLKTGSPVTLNQVSKGDNRLFKQFGKGFEPDEEAFADIDTAASSNGLPVLTDALASLEGQVVSQMEAGDHIIYLIEISSGVSHSASEGAVPFVHTRKNGFNY